MASAYPAALDTLPTNHVDDVGEFIHAVDVNNLADAVNKIEGELGTDPAGTFTTVRARQDARLTCRKTADQTNATTTLANVTDLSFAIASGQDYWFRFFIPWSSNTSGVTAQFAVTVPALTGYVAVLGSNAGGGTTAPATGGINVVHDMMATASGTVLGGAGGSAAAPPTSGVLNVMVLEGILSNASAAGTLQVQCKAETTGTITVKRGAYGELYLN